MGKKEKMKRIAANSLTEELLDIRGQDLIVLSTYFTSKKDPQRHVFQKENDYQYMKNWYESILEHDLIAFVFYDSLSDDFVAEFQNINVRFIKSNLGTLSLNDERIFIYSEFLSLFSQDIFVLATDINDVVVNRNPINLFKNNKATLFVGRGDRKFWASHYWNLKKMYEFKKQINEEISAGIFLCPVFNAGLIGGEIEVVRNLFKNMIYYFNKMHVEGNFNMNIMNLVIYEKYCNNDGGFLNFFGFNNVFYFFSFIHKIIVKLQLMSYCHQIIEVSESDIFNIPNSIYSGSPFNSRFRKYENRDSTVAYLIHK
jgi:hypothetical protein